MSLTEMTENSGGAKPVPVDMNRTSTSTSAAALPSAPNMESKTIELTGMSKKDGKCFLCLFLNTLCTS